ncbi:hypothetical protein Q8A73_012827 [Channa argus]|nr:hypothetical protein Q8A73_012827 [Channa argus]
MSVNSFMPSSDPQCDLQLSSVNSSTVFELCCFMSKPGNLVFALFTITNLVLILPLCILILYHGVRRWRQQRTPAATVTHSESFTYHLATMEFINVFGSVYGCFAIYKNDLQMLVVSYYAASITWYGETFFHLLTCLEHYLAVIHPVTYLSLKKLRWIRVRNIIIGCIWLLSFGGMSLMVVVSRHIGRCPEEPIKNHSKCLPSRTERISVKSCRLLMHA